MRHLAVGTEGKLNLGAWPDQRIAPWNGKLIIDARIQKLAVRDHSSGRVAVPGTEHCMLDLRSSKWGTQSSLAEGVGRQAHHDVGPRDRQLAQRGEINLLETNRDIRKGIRRPRQQLVDDRRIGHRLTWHRQVIAYLHEKHLAIA